ncbi:hypothetical protein PR202_gb25040 [Eleusine coracana subsp. coracana]|uniref:Uncharacterized protein n=1 Tax=Eleusine coracana subsp. coracana TaxID=191504 RepID=A0AAV5FN76_ELECO|nr:hypothetical protein PR202_gb25040 [Eleusine coracana subsp. coracana]
MIRRSLLLHLEPKLRQRSSKPANSQTPQRQEGNGVQGAEEKLDITKIKDDISSEKFKLIDEIKGKIEGMKVGDKIIDEINRKLEEIKSGNLQIDQKQVSDILVDLQEGQSSIQPLGILLLALRLLKADATAAATTEEANKLRKACTYYQHHTKTLSKKKNSQET